MQERTRFESELRTLGLQEREVIPPRDDRTPVPDTTLVPFRWICRITANTQKGHSFGSGVVIGPRHILTCAHVIYPLQDLYRTEEILVSPGQNNSDQPLGQYRANGWIVHPQWMRGRQPHCGFDYGIIRLRENIATKTFAKLRNQPLGYWGSVNSIARLQAIDPRVLTGQTIRLAGYPGDLDTEARRMYYSRGPIIGSALFNACGGHPQDKIFPDVNVQSRLLLHEADTFGSQSGCPVWTYDNRMHERLLVGIHQGANHLVDRTGTRRPVNLAVRVTDEVINQVATWIRTFVER